MKKGQKKEISKPPVIFSDTQQLIEKIETHLDGPLLCYWNSNSGNVCANDALAIHEILQERKLKIVYLLIKSEGGSGIASLRIINIIRNYAEKIIALIPLECASAATMIALGANEIHMGPVAYLTAIDTSLRHDLSPVDKDNERVSVSMDELVRVVRLWDQHKSD
ncbi:MAG: SDH family Clp fold serine proteinase, partial [Spirochaetota bacterium]